MVWNLTLADPAPWTDQGRDDPTSDGPFSPLRLAAASGRTATGLAFHQSSTACRQIDVALASGAPAYVELRRYDGSTDTTASGLSNIHMEQDHASDQHVRLFFKPHSSVAAGTVADITLIATPHSSCTDPATPTPLTVSWSLTVAAPGTWVDQGRDKQSSDGPFSPLKLSAATEMTETGLVFHQSSEACRRIDVALASGAPDYLELIRYQGDSAATDSSMDDIHMERGHASDHHVRLFIKPRATVAAGDVIDLTLIATPNAACTDPATPAPLMLDWSLTIATPAAWINQGRDDPDADGPLEPLNGTGIQSSHDTGLAFHRSSTACRRIDVALANSPPAYVELVRYQGNAAASNRSLSGHPDGAGRGERPSRPPVLQRLRGGGARQHGACHGRRDAERGLHRCRHPRRR